MTFPASPTNGASTLLNGVSYTYNAAYNSWTRNAFPIGALDANLGTATTNITTLGANVGAFEAYANTKIGTNTNSNLVVVATTPSVGPTTGALVVKGGIGVAGNVYADTLYTTTGVAWAGNGVAFSSGGGSSLFTADATPPTTPVLGEQWYDTTTDVLYEFIAGYWVDIQSSTVHTGEYNIVTVDNIVSTANITTANIYADRFFYSNGTAFSSSNFGNTDVEAYIGANLGAATTNITTLFGNAATQATSINTTNANLGAFQTYANLHFSDTSFGNSNVASYLTSNTSGLVSVTSSLQIPKGTTGERPETPVAGALRYNTTLGRFEGYLTGGGWQNILSDNYTVEWLVVAGGGGGGSRHGGGGGAGGLRAGTAFTVSSGASYTVTVGAGGTGNPDAGTATAGTAGYDSVFSTVTSTGGGAGGGNTFNSVSNGGSGGGGGNGTVGGAVTAITPVSGETTTVQGYAGGSAASPYNVDYWAAGGGGAGGVGQNGNAGKAGGAGATSAITGATVTYACGGGGGAFQGLGSGGDGGAGGSSGINGGKGNGSTAGSNGTANTGTGGGGGGASAGFNGGSGVVIVRYLGSQKGTGGVVTSSGGYTIHTFTGSGSFVA